MNKGEVAKNRPWSEKAKREHRAKALEMKQGYRREKKHDTD